MTNTERFRRFFSGDTSIDRTPAVEWASWWDVTVNNWYTQGLDKEIDIQNGINEYWGQDRLMQFWLPVRDTGFHGLTAGTPVCDEAYYQKVKKFMYTDALLEKIYQDIKTFRDQNQDKGYACWYTLEGFFWFPRTLFGIEEHLYAFYDFPGLLKEMNSDLTAYHKKVLQVVFSLIKPQFMSFAEDMSYNHGPMLSKAQYDEFMLPYYNELIPEIKKQGTKVFIDTDGFVEPLIPWFLEGGIEGILPLERMAGVDVNRIRGNFPELYMIGGFDKTVMHKGEQAMREEFERILPAIQSGRYIPSVDHQTPPDVDMKTYRIYMKLLLEYSIMPKK